MKSGIYCIKNKINNKRYIGMSTEIPTRQQRHFIRLLRGKHPNIHLQDSFNKYGQKTFEFTILEFVDKNQLPEREKYWVTYFNTINPNKGYNLTTGGTGGDTFTNNPNKEEIRKKFKKIMFKKSYSHNQNCICMFCRIKRGEKVIHTEKSKKLMSQIKMGHITSKETIEKLKRVWVSNTELKQSKAILKEQVLNYLKNGWIKARLFNAGCIKVK